MLKKYRIPAVLLLMMAMPFAGIAAGPPAKSELSNPLAITLLIVIIGLLFAIGGLAYVVISAAQFYYQRVKEVKAQGENPLTKVVTVLACVMMLATAANAQEAADAVAATAEPVSNTISGLSKVSFYALLSVIGLELLVLFILLYNLKVLLVREKRLSVAEAGEQAEVVVVSKKKRFKDLWMKLNSFRSMHEESAIELDHNYDGIRELDNKLPPWWLYLFYVCIIFAVVYLWRYHVSHSAPLSKEEFEQEMAKAEVEKQAYLAKAANNVDENTVTLLTDGAAIESGKKIFTSNCAACHSADGGGGVGPNLTDNYWLHGGDVKDVFKTIKYGVPEKGMKSWKDDFSPVQLAQLASFVKSLHGTKPATAKEPQGELYEDKGGQQAQPKDSTAVSLK